MPRNLRNDGLHITSGIPLTVSHQLQFGRYRGDVVAKLVAGIEADVVIILVNQCHGGNQLMIGSHYAPRKGSHNKQPGDRSM